MSGASDAKPYQPRRGPDPASLPFHQVVGDVAVAPDDPPNADDGACDPGNMELHYDEDAVGTADEEVGHDGGEEDMGPMDEDAALAAAGVGVMDAHVLGTATQLGSNQLTLSFQGEVYVFDAVSPEKVQAVLLLLGGKELSPGAGALSTASQNYNKVNFPHRMASLMRFREKRKERNFDKKIRYTVRKEVALRMQRNKGQFTSSKSKAEDVTSSVTSPDGSSSWAIVEGRPPSAAECHHCGTNAKSTPMMRRGPDGPRTLCNACGLMWANKGTLRDLSKAPPPVALQVVPPDAMITQGSLAISNEMHNTEVAANGRDP